MSPMTPWDYVRTKWANQTHLHAFMVSDIQIAKLEKGTTAYYYTCLRTYTEYRKQSHIYSKDDKKWDGIADPKMTRTYDDLDDKMDFYDKSSHVKGQDRVIMLMLINWHTESEIIKELKVSKNTVHETKLRLVNKLNLQGKFKKPLKIYDGGKSNYVVSTTKGDIKCDTKPEVWKILDRHTCIKIHSENNKSVREWRNKCQIT